MKSIGEFISRLQTIIYGGTIMQIQINTGHNVNGQEKMIRKAEAVVESTLGHLAERITRIEVHLSDENSEKGGSGDKRCLMEARLRGHQPIAVTNEAETIDQAVSGAVDKLKNSLDHTLGRLGGHEVRKHMHTRAARALFDTFGQTV
jgi:Sigma 54 modulation protein / S30EA ribosomal protein